MGLGLFLRPFSNGGDRIDRVITVRFICLMLFGYALTCQMLMAQMILKFYLRVFYPFSLNA